MSRLKSIKISNFKSIKDMKIEFAPGFNCVTGPNGTGKSNLLGTHCPHPDRHLLSAHPAVRCDLFRADH